MFSSTAVHSEESTKRRKKLARALEVVVTEMRSGGLRGDIARPSCALFEALVYKFGRSNRHQKFWRIGRQCYQELKRLNRQPVLEPFERALQRLQQSKFAYAPTKRCLRFLATVLLRRILHLDRLRLICARSADCSMGFIELRHFLTFNLMSIAIASDVAAEAHRQMQMLAVLYASLGRWFRQSSRRLPSSIDGIQLKSIAVLSDPSQKAEAKRLKSHDLALLRREIEEIGQTGSTTNQEEQAEDEGDKLSQLRKIARGDFGQSNSPNNLLTMKKPRNLLLKTRKKKLRVKKFSREMMELEE